MDEAKTITYTSHAETALRERQLEKGWIEKTARFPAWRQTDPGGGGVERRFRVIEERGGRVLRVVCMETADEIRIISAFLDRRARRPI